MAEASCPICGRQMVSDREYQIHLEDAHGLTDDAGTSSQVAEPEPEIHEPASPPPPNERDFDSPIATPWGATAAAGGSPPLSASQGVDSTPRRNRIPLLAVLLAAGVALLGAVGYAIEGSLAGSSSPATTTTTTIAPTRPASITLEEWAGENTAVISLVSAAIDEVEAAANTVDFEITASACQDLSYAVSEAQKGLPVPDPYVNRPYSEGLRYLALSADACIEGATDYDMDQISLAGDYMTKGSDLIDEAVAGMSN